MPQLKRFILCFLWATLCFAPGPVHAQDSAVAIQEAIALYKNGRPADAIERLQGLLASPDTVSLDRNLRAKAQAYLAMSYLATDRPSDAQGAVEQAILTAAPVMVEHAGAWPKHARAILDSAVAHLVADAVMLYEDVECERSVEQLQATAHLDGIVDRTLVAEIHKYLAFNYVALGRLDLARQAFQSALRADPALTLGADAVIAPKLRRTFTVVRREALVRSRTRALRNSLWRSTLMPGWGQVYRGQRLKGYGFMAVQAGLVTGTAFAVHAFLDARDAYHRFDIEAAQAIYDQRHSIQDVNTALKFRYNRYASTTKRANVLIGFTAGVWGLNLLDALILSNRRDDAGMSRASVDRTVRVAVTGDAAAREWSVQYQVAW